MTHEEMLEHLKKGVVFKPPRRYSERKPGKNENFTIFTPEQKRNYFLVRKGDYSPYKKRFK